MVSPRRRKKSRSREATALIAAHGALPLRQHVAPKRTTRDASAAIAVRKTHDALLAVRAVEIAATSYVVSASSPVSSIWAHPSSVAVLVSVRSTPPATIANVTSASPSLHTETMAPSGVA